MTRRRALWRIKKRYGAAARAPSREALEARVWKRTHSDYRGHVDGRRAILVWSDRGTTLKPLDLMTIAELERYAR